MYFVNVLCYLTPMEPPDANCEFNLTDVLKLSNDLLSVCVESFKAATSLKKQLKALKCEKCIYIQQES